MGHESKTTTDHDEIRRWAEERNGKPATVRGTQDDDGSPGVLRIDFEGYGAGEEELEPVEWEAWFEKFEESEVAFLHQDEKADGETSTFFKLVSRDS